MKRNLEILLGFEVIARFPNQFSFYFKDESLKFSSFFVSKCEK